MIDLAKQEAHKQKKAQLDASMPKPMEKPQVSYAEQFKPDMSVESPGHTFNETHQMVGALERKNYVRGFNTWADAEKAGDVSQQEWITQKINQMVERGENPGEYETLMSLMGSAETPDEIKKRERRNALGETFRNLGNLIGNAANLYYTNKGGQYIDLNTANEKHRERMQRLKDKQDALAEKRNNILINAKLGDFKAARAEKAAKDKAAKDAAEKREDRAWKAKYDAYMKELDNAYKLGQIDAQTKAKLETLAVQADNAEKLEAIRQNNRITLKTTPSAAESKVLTSLTGSDGGTWTRNTQLSKEEVRELSKYVEDLAPYTKIDEESGKEDIDYVGAIADAAESGMIPDYILEEKGFKKSKASNRRNGEDIKLPESKKSKSTSLGLGIGSNNKNKLGIGL